MKIRSIRMLQHFLAASQTQNFHKAAQAEGISQTALTKSIQQLEHTLGVELFVRSSKGVSLTRFGEALISRAKRIETECEFIEREMDILSGIDGSEINIAAGSVWSAVLLPRIISKLHHSWPNLRFSLIRSSGAQFSNLFANRKIDIGLGALDTIIRESANLDEKLICEPISEISTSFFAHRSHPLHSQGLISPAEICVYPRAEFRPDPELNERVDSYFTSAGLQQNGPSLVSDSLSSVMQTLVYSKMTTCLPTPLSPVAALFDVRPLKAASPWTFQTGIVYRAGSSGYPYLDDLITQLKMEMNMDGISTVDL